jgi:hypothetical protein
MGDVLYLKFRQHSDLRALLFSTYPAELVLVEPRDPFWGDDAGRNELGKSLMPVRDKKKKENYVPLSTYFSPPWMWFVLFLYNFSVGCSGCGGIGHVFLFLLTYVAPGLRYLYVINYRNERCISTCRYCPLSFQTSIYNAALSTQVSGSVTILEEGHGSPHTAKRRFKAVDGPRDIGAFSYLTYSLPRFSTLRLQMYPYPPTPYLTQRQMAAVEPCELPLLLYDDISVRQRHKSTNLQLFLGIKCIMHRGCTLHRVKCIHVGYP